MSTVNISPDQPNNVTITQETSRVVVVSAPGPKGDRGPAGITNIVAGDGLSGGGSTAPITLNLDTGSAHFLDALSAISNAGIFKQTGSFWATTNDLQITGSLTIGGGVLKLQEFETTPTVEPGAIFYSGSNFYFGIE